MSNHEISRLYIFKKKVFFLLVVSTVILVDSYDRTPITDGDGLDEHIRLSNALSSSGLSITLTSLCSAMAFFVGSAIDISGVSSFCIYAACSFLANYVLQFLIFVPLMVIDDRRIRKKRNSCCPCCCGYDDAEKAMVNIQSAGSSVPSNSRSSMTTSSELHIEPQSSILSKVLLPVMTRRIPRLLIITLFLCTLSASIYVIPSIRTESVAQNYVPDDSMILDFLETLDRVYSGDYVRGLDVVIKDQDFSDIAVRDTVYGLMADLEAQDDALGAVSNWLDEFELFLNETGL